MDRLMARKLIVDSAPNRLFIKYLNEWRDEAKAKGDKSSFTYGKACKSLKKYPLPLQCGAEAKILENFGSKICKLLDERLAKDADESGMTPAEFLEKSRKVPPSWWDKVNKEISVATKKPAKRKKAIQNENKVPLKSKKTQSSKTIPELFSLPKVGHASEEIKPAYGTIIEKFSPVVSVSSVFNEASSQETCFTLFPGQFDIVLCADTRETMGESRQKEMGVEFGRQSVLYEQRTLHIGDFLWLAREKSALCAGRKPKELVLDYVIERKIVSDLSMSIRDGRFHEQKIRLKNSGISNIIYLIENMNEIENQSLPEQTLRQAIYNTQIVDNICVKFTKNAKATVCYLDLMTKRLQKLYQSCTLEAVEVTDSQEESLNFGHHKLIPFSVFNEMGSKQKKLTVKEMFLRQLMQIHGISYDKASAITTVYETPDALIQKYRDLATVKEKEGLLSKIKFGINERNLGIAISRVVHKVYST